MSMRQLKISHSITNRESQSLVKYLQEVSKLEMITPEEENNLALLIKEGDKTAIDRLVKANLRFVVSVAKQYQHQGILLADLINEGNIGLIKAARNFDPSRGFKFISYAVWWIRQQITQSLAENARIIRLPLNKVTLQGRIKKAGDLLEQKLERPATAEELAEELNTDPEEIKASLSSGQQHISLDIAVGNESEDSMIDMIKNTNAADADRELTYNESLMLEIKRSFRMLNKRQKDVLCWFFGIGIDHPMSLEDIASRLYVTTERARQIKDKALDLIKQSGSVQLLRNYLAA